MGCELTTTVWMQAGFVLLVVFVAGFIAGAGVKSPRLTRLERKVGELEVRVKLRKAGGSWE